MRYLITGSAGFIGYHLSLKLLKKGFLVFGIDSLNNYYSNKLKLLRLENLKRFKNFYFKDYFNDYCFEKDWLTSKVWFVFVYDLKIS